MSGGHFNYDQYKIGQIADDIQLLVDTNHSEEMTVYGDRMGRGYPRAIIDCFEHAVKALRVAQIYAQRIDWLVSGDDGTDSFLARLAADLADMDHQQGMGSHD